MQHEKTEYNKKMYEYVQKDRGKNLDYNKFKRKIMKGEERKTSSTDNVDKYGKVNNVI
jgi:hypothetical protein